MLAFASIKRSQYVKRTVTMSTEKITHKKNETKKNSETQLYVLMHSFVARICMKEIHSICVFACFQEILQVKKTVTTVHSTFKITRFNTLFCSQDTHRESDLCLYFWEMSQI